MKDKEITSISKMIEYCDKCAKYTKDCSFEEFVMNDMAVEAVVFDISQIGELVKNISENVKRKYTNIYWNMIKGLRNRIVHDYEGIKHYMIWKTVKEDLPQLKAYLEEILEKENK